MRTQQTQQMVNQIIETIGFYRSMILDLIEIEIADKEKWRQIRSRLLRAFGPRGIEGKILEILDPSNTQKSNKGV